MIVTQLFSCPKRHRHPVTDRSQCCRRSKSSSSAPDGKPRKMTTWNFPGHNQNGCGSKPMGSHFGVGALPILVYFSGDWHVHWGYGILTHGYKCFCFCTPPLTMIRTKKQQKQNAKNGEERTPSIKWVYPKSGEEKQGQQRQHCGWDYSLLTFIYSGSHVPFGGRCSSIFVSG